MLLIRLLSIIALMLSLAFYFLPFAYDVVYSPSVVEHLFYTPVDPLLQLSQFQIDLLFVFGFISYLVLICKVKYGKYLFWVNLGLGFLGMLVGGFSAYTNIDLLVLTLRDMLNGVILYLTLQHPIKRVRVIDI